MKAGDKIKFVKTLDCAANEDHPAFEYAKKGQTGEIVQVGGCREGFWVKTDNWPHKFGASEEEFVMI